MASLLAAKDLLGQGFVPTALRTDNQVIQSLTEKVEQAGWLYLKDGAQVQPYGLFSTYKPDMGLGENDEMVLVKSEVDEYGIEHNRYQQYHMGVRVEGAEYTEHVRNCIVKIAHGKLLENITETTVPTVTEANALTAALDTIGAEIYSWQDTASVGVNEYEEEDDTLANAYPQGELLLAYIVPQGVLAENYQLCWRFEIVSNNPGTANEVYVDAETGDVLKLAALGCNNGPATLLYGYGTQTIDTKFHNGWFSDYYFLRAQDDTRNIHTRKGTFADHGNRWRRYDEVKDDNDCWGCGTPAPVNISTTAHWIVSQAWDYFRIAHNRIGWDGNGGRIRVLSNSNLQNNAFFRFGDGLGLGWLEFGETDDGFEFAAIDIGGHEFTHGFIRQVSGLATFGEPGALNESFSDIFGFLIERFSFPQNFDWIIGEDAFAPSIHADLQRSLENPGAIALNTNSLPPGCRPTLGLPNVVNGARWYTGPCDNGGVHINCGPQNRWFNLLSVGGLEAETGINVQGIGITNAAKITYYSLNHFIQNLSMYADARQAAFAAAGILFGECSFEAIQTTNAWAAVGVGGLFAGTCIEIAGPDWICVEPQGLPQSWHADALAGSNITWDVPSSWNFTLSGVGNSTLTLTSVSPFPATVTYETVEAASSNGGTATLNVTVVHDCELFSPPCPPDGTGERSSSLSRQDVVEKKISAIYPNPASEFLTISVTGGEFPFDFSVVDVFGRKVSSKRVSSSEAILDVSALLPGVYYLNIYNSQFREVHPFIKQ